VNAWALALMGFALGGLAGALAAWIYARRGMRRTRIAERRARRAERLAEIGAMTGGLAHEIRNPLSTISLNAQLLSEGLADAEMPGEERERLTRRMGALRREVERLRDILESFLRFAGEVRIEKRDADLNEVVEELADFYLAQAESQGVRLRVDLAAAPIVAPIDVSQLKQAALNLMINATQAMTGPDVTDGRSKELILKTERARDVEGEAARLHVIDTGPGMSPETVAKIFTPYFTTKGGGSGLGLSISRRIVEEHGGRLEVHTEPGQGTDFVITLPLIEMEAASP